MTPRIKAGMLSAFFFVCAAAAITTHFIREAEERELNPQDLYQVIVAQFVACHSDQYRAAYNQASRGVQENLTLVQFETKVRSEYARIPQPRNLEFGRIQLRHERASVEIYFVSDVEEVTPALYTLVKENGSWRIENFEVFESWPTAWRLRGMRI
jgi:Domain of unknown function (DUF4864)